MASTTALSGANVASTTTCGTLAKWRDSGNAARRQARAFHATYLIRCALDAWSSTFRWAMRPLEPDVHSNHVFPFEVRWSAPTAESPIAADFVCMRVYATVDEAGSWSCHAQLHGRDYPQHYMEQHCDEVIQAAIDARSALLSMTDLGLEPELLAKAQGKATVSTRK